MSARLEFYSLPPTEIDYPFILLNASHPNQGLRYIKAHFPRALIIDSGIEIFRDPSVKNYPEGHLERLISLYDYAKAYSEKTLLTVPDYCDDYIPGNLWESKDITNIERTHRNVISALDHFPDVNWLIPIQGHNEKPESILKHIALLDADGILQKRHYFAVANLCTSKSSVKIKSTLNLAKWYLQNKKIHSFGISLNAALQLKGVIDSFDSMAWTFPRGKGGHSCRTKAERIEYFVNFVNRIAAIPYGLSKAILEVVESTPAPPPLE